MQITAQTAAFLLTGQDQPFPRALQVLAQQPRVHRCTELAGQIAHQPRMHLSAPTFVRQLSAL